MLKICERPLFTTTVVVMTAALQGSFKATFVAMETDRLDALQKEGEANGRGFRHWLPLVVESFDEVELPPPPSPVPGPDGVALASPLMRLLAWPGVGPAMVRAYFKALWEEAEKNSLPSPAGS